GGATVAAIVVPRAAPHHPVAAARGAGRIDGRAAAVVILVVPVGAPLADVAVHVEKSVGVRAVGADRHRVLAVLRLAGAPVGACVSKLASFPDSLKPKWYGIEVRAPPRQARSHSASVGRR